jgi:hypothetical protein
MPKWAFYRKQFLTGNYGAPAALEGSYAFA